MSLVTRQNLGYDQKCITKGLKKMFSSNHNHISFNVNKESYIDQTTTTGNTCRIFIIVV